MRELTIRATLGALLLGAALVMTHGRALAEEEATLQCSCRACDPEACCVTPSGMATLDEKCSTKCSTKKWTVKAHQNCAPQAGCCPEKQRR
jgi:hypothetical protein